MSEIKRLTMADIEKGEFPITMKPIEAREKIFGNEICENKLYEMLNRKGCPVISNGNKKIIVTRKFIEWLEGQCA